MKKNRNTEKISWKLFWLKDKIRTLEKKVYKPIWVIKANWNLKKWNKRNNYKKDF